MNEYKDIYVYIECRHDKVQDVSFELLGEARRLVDQIKHVAYKVVAVILGENVESHTKELIEYGADEIIICHHPLLKEYHTESYSNVLYDVINKFKPDAFLIGATVLGRDLAPRVAARCETGLTADATSISIDTETPNSTLLLVTRPAFGGNLFGTIICKDKRPQMATIRPKVLEPIIPDTSRCGKVVNFDVHLEKNEIHTQILHVINKVQKEVDLSKADIIISGGRGIGNHFDLLNSVAKELGGVVGASRAAVDLGYATKDMQVGQTGKTVRPRLYIACGISGAVQHMAGMENSDYIIAINKDKEAPIFSIANLGIVGDALEILPKLKEEIIKIT